MSHYLQILENYINFSPNKISYGNFYLFNKTYLRSQAKASASPAASALAA